MSLSNLIADIINQEELKESFELEESDLDQPFHKALDPSEVDVWLDNLSKNKKSQQDTAVTDMISKHTDLNVPSAIVKRSINEKEGLGSKLLKNICLVVGAVSLLTIALCSVADKMPEGSQQQKAAIQQIQKSDDAANKKVNELIKQAGSEAGSEGGTEAGSEAGSEGGTDAGGTDAGSEAGAEAGTEAGSEAGTEAGYETKNLSSIDLDEDDDRNIYGTTPKKEREEFHAFLGDIEGFDPIPYKDGNYISIGYGTQLRIGDDYDKNSEIKDQITFKDIATAIARKCNIQPSKIKNTRASVLSNLEKKIKKFKSKIKEHEVWKKSNPLSRYQKKPKMGERFHAERNKKIENLKRTINKLEERHLTAQYTGSISKDIAELCIDQYNNDTNELLVKDFPEFIKNPAVPQNFRKFMYDLYYNSGKFFLTNHKASEGIQEFKKAIESYHDIFEDSEMYELIKYRSEHSQSLVVPSETDKQYLQKAFDKIYTIYTKGEAFKSFRATHARRYNKHKKNFDTILQEYRNIEVESESSSTDKNESRSLKSVYSNLFS